MTVPVTSGEKFRVLKRKTFHPSPPFEGVATEPIGPDADELNSHFVQKWEAARLRRETRRIKASRSRSMREFHVPKYSDLGASIASDLASEGRKGLLGEIVTQLLVEDCCRSVRVIYVNYEHTGTANQYGIDLAGVVDKEEVVLVESKFCGTGESNKNNFQSYLVQRVRKALSYFEDPSELEMKLSDVYFRILLNETFGRATPKDAEQLKKLFESGNCFDLISAPFDHRGLDQNELLETSAFDPPARSTTLTSLNLADQNKLLAHL